MKAGLKTAEDELNLIKNQVQQTLLDIREHILDVTNPFNSIDDALTDEDEIEFDDLMGGGIGGGADGAPGADGGSRGGEGGDTDGSDDLEGAVDGDGEEVEELRDDALDDPGEEIIEEIPDDGYMGDEIIDDGGGMGGAMSGMSDPDEYFEQEEEIPEEIEEAFEPDVEPEDSVEDSNAPRDGADLADTAGDDADLEGEGGAFGTLAPLAANFDVLTMAGLVRWVAVTTDRLGVNRTEIMLDAFEAAGRIERSTRIVLHHLMALTEEDPSEPVPVRAIVSAMVRMEGVLDSSKSADSTRLLSMLMDVDEDPLDLVA